MGLWKKEEIKAFNKLGYPVPYTIELRLNIDEAKLLKKILNWVSKADNKDASSILNDLNREIKDYDKALTKRYERPWCKADDY